MTGSSVIAHVEVSQENSGVGRRRPFQEPGPLPPTPRGPGRTSVPQPVGSGENPVVLRGNLQHSGAREQSPALSRSPGPEPVLSVEFLVMCSSVVLENDVFGENVK